LTYSAVASAGRPPRPQSTNNSNANTANKKPEPKPAKMLQPLYPKASREVIVMFNNTNTFTTRQQVDDKALKMVNSALVNSPIVKRLFYGARFSLASNLVLTTGLHETNEDLGDYLEVIGKVLHL
jgi:hypothetical protein